MKTLFKISLFFLLLTQIQYSQWVQVGPAGLTITSLATNGSNIFAGTYLDGLYRSTDDGETWIQTSLNAAIISSIAINGAKIYAGGNGIYLSNDNGQSWQETPFNNSISVRSLIVSGTKIFTGTTGGLFYSIDDGHTWTQTQLTSSVFSLSISGSNFFAGTEFGVYRSVDNGQTWTQTSLDSIWIRSIVVSGSNVLAGTWEEGLYYSTNNGDTWLHTFALYDIPALLVYGIDTFAASLGVYHSTNNGQTWIDLGLSNITILALSISDQYIYAGRVLGLSIWRRPLNEITPVELSTFSASVVNSEIILNWTTASELNNQGFEIEQSFDNQNFSKIGFIPGSGTTTETKSYSFKVYNVSAEVQYYRLKQIDFDGTYEYSNSIEVDGSVPTDFVLHQNYPNPFNPSTTIKYSIPANEFVNLEVYDVLGNRIATLINEEKPAGNYKVTFDASVLPSGIYFHKLQAGRFVETKKMILMK